MDKIDEILQIDKDYYNESKNNRGSLEAKTSLLLSTGEEIFSNDGKTTYCTAYQTR